MLIENLPSKCEATSLKLALINVVEHLMDFHMSIFRMKLNCYGYHQLELNSPDDFISDGQRVVDKCNIYLSNISKID